MSDRQQPTSTVAPDALFIPPQALQDAILENGVADANRDDRADLSSGESVVWSGDQVVVNGLAWYYFSEVATFPFSGWAALDEHGALCNVCETFEEIWDYSPRSGRPE